MQKYLIIIFGLIFMAIGVFMYFRNQNLIKNCTVETVATVVDMKEELDNDSDFMSYMYYPILEYKVGEDTLRVKMDKGSNNPVYDINEKVTILYNPNKTTQFIVKGDKSSSLFVIVFMVIGLLAAGYGIKMAISGD